VHGLNNPRSGFLNSWCLSLMVVFHLQQSQPALLPPLWQLFGKQQEPRGGGGGGGAAGVQRPLEGAKGPGGQVGDRRGGGGGGHGGRRPAAPMKYCRKARADPPSPPPPSPCLLQAPYHLLEQVHVACAQLAEEYRAQQPPPPLVSLLAGFFARFSALLDWWVLCRGPRGGGGSSCRLPNRQGGGCKGQQPSPA